MFWVLWQSANLLTTQSTERSLSGNNGAGIRKVSPEDKRELLVGLHYSPLFSNPHKAAWREIQISKFPRCIIFEKNGIWITSKSYSYLNRKPEGQKYFTASTRFRRSTYMRWACWLYYLGISKIIHSYLAELHVPLLILQYKCGYPYKNVVVKSRSWHTLYISVVKTWIYPLLRTRSIWITGICQRCT